MLTAATVLHDSGKCCITLLRQYVQPTNGQNQTQLAKNIVNANEIQGLHIGDVINYQGFDEETKVILQELQEILQQIKIQTSPQTGEVKYRAKTNSETQLIVPVPVIVKSFEFEVVTIDAYSQETKRCSKQTEYFIENLGNIVLEMVSIPSGKFQMGAAKDEEASQEERPQRIVNIKSFFMGKYLPHPLFISSKL